MQSCPQLCDADDDDDNGCTLPLRKSYTHLNISDARGVKGVNRHIRRMQEAKKGSAWLHRAQESAVLRTASSTIFENEGQSDGLRRAVSMYDNVQSESTTFPARSWTMYAGDMHLSDLSASSSFDPDPEHESEDPGGTACAGAGPETRISTGTPRRWHSMCCSLESLQVGFYGMPGCIPGAKGDAGPLAQPAGLPDPRSLRAPCGVGKAAWNLRRKTGRTAAAVGGPRPDSPKSQSFGKMRRQRPVALSLGPANQVPGAPRYTSPTPAPLSPDSPDTPCSEWSAGSCASSPAASPVEAVQAAPGIAAVVELVSCPSSVRGALRHRR